MPQYYLVSDAPPEGHMAFLADSINRLSSYKVRGIALVALMDMAAEEDIAAMTAYYNMDLMDKALAKAQIEGDIIDGVIRANLRDYLEGLEHEDDD